MPIGMFSRGRLIFAITEESAIRARLSFYGTGTPPAFHQASNHSENRENPMRAWRRLTTSMASRFEAVVSQIENHDALVNATIRESEEARARAKVRLAQVSRDLNRTRRQLAGAEEAAELWKARAVRVASEDEARALECLRRRKHAEREREVAKEHLIELVDAENQLSRDITRVSQRIEDLRRRRNLLRARESRAEALQSCRGVEGTVASDLEEILERWEVKIATSEGLSDSELDSDPLETEFSEEEEIAMLRSELNELRDSEDRE